MRISKTTKAIGGGAAAALIVSTLALGAAMRGQGTLVAADTDRGRLATSGIRRG